MVNAKTILRMLWRTERAKLKRCMLIFMFCAALTLLLTGQEETTVTIDGRMMSMNLDLSKLNDEDFEPFEPDVREDFPTIPGNVYTIPHVLHQIYEDYYIPSKMVHNVQSFINMNPEWTYYFWTYDSGRRLIAERYPYLIDIWDNYLKPKSRANALKFIVLYEFGGVYADLDVTCLRPLERATKRFSCVFPPEPFEHSVFLHGIPYLIGNSVILCRMGHPFLKQIVKDLQRSAVFSDQVDVTGPSFVTYNFLEYNNISLTKIFKVKKTIQTNSPYFYKGERFKNEDDINAVYIPNTVYFTDSINKRRLSRRSCYNSCQKIKEKSRLIRRACYNLFRRGYERFRNPFTFTEPNWLDIYEYTKKSYLHSTHISKIVPSYRYIEIQ
ncbi:hypothetical protein ACF0H5_007222 [Mactra antiquata]